MNRSAYKGISLLGIIGAFFALLIVAAILFPLFAKARVHVYDDSCINHVRQLEIGILTYAQDHDEAFPLPADWVSASGLSADPKLFNCPQSRQQGTLEHPEYGMNAFLYDTDLKTGTIYGIAIEALANPSIIEAIADINGPTSNDRHLINGKPTNPFPNTYTINGFAAGSNGGLRHPDEQGLCVAYADGHVTVVHPNKLTAAGRTRYNLPVGDKGGLR